MQQELAQAGTGDLGTEEGVSVCMRVVQLWQCTWCVLKSEAQDGWSWRSLRCGWACRASKSVWIRWTLRWDQLVEVATPVRGEAEEQTQRERVCQQEGACIWIQGKNRVQYSNCSYQTSYLSAAHDTGASFGCSIVLPLTAMMASYTCQDTTWQDILVKVI